MRTEGGAGRGRQLSRRGLLRIGVLAVLAGPAIAACTDDETAKSAPDSLQPMLNLATKDATTAQAAATAFPGAGPTFAAIAAVRQQHASALRTEVDRAAAVTGQPSATSSSATPPPTDQSAVINALVADLADAQKQAASLLPALPRYRAGLVGSVAGGCASLAEAMNGAPITTTSATSATPAPSGGSPTLNGSSSGTLTADTAQALQQALAAENAAYWLYGTASAFASGGVEPELVAAMGAVQNLRDATQARLTAGQVTPQPPQPAYLPPKPMTNQPSALVDLAIAESDATVAWRSVLEHTDDASLRTAALAALIDSAVRETRWRRLAGQTPASVAMPGLPS